MHSHKTRVIAILVAWSIMAIGMIVLIVVGQTEGTGFGIVTGALGTLTPALLDAASVERRRRNPETPAITDDVKAAAEKAEVTA